MLEGIKPKTKIYLAGDPDAKKYPDTFYLGFRIPQFSL
jgi:hypothetical protein